MAFYEAVELLDARAIVILCTNTNGKVHSAPCSKLTGKGTQICKQDPEHLLQRYL